MKIFSVLQNFNMRLMKLLVKEQMNQAAGDLDNIQKLGKGMN